MIGDPDRAQVYLAEHRLEALLDTNGRVRSLGREWQLGARQVFTTVASAQGFCTLTCIELGLPMVTVTLSERAHQCSYRPAHDRSGRGASGHHSLARISLAPWGGTALTVSHELAHHVVFTEQHAAVAAHGVEFRTALVNLLVHNGAASQGEWLAEAWRQSGLVVARAQ